MIKIIIINIGNLLLEAGGEKLAARVEGLIELPSSSRLVLYRLVSSDLVWASSHFNWPTLSRTEVPTSSWPAGQLRFENEPEPFGWNSNAKRNWRLIGSSPFGKLRFVVLWLFTGLSRWDKKQPNNGELPLLVLSESNNFASILPPNGDNAKRC